MIINTRQAADILGVSLATIRGLANKGVLKPIAGGDARKHKQFEAKDVRAIKSEYKPNKRVYTNGHGQLPLTPETSAPLEVKTTSNPVQSFNDRLRRIEEKIDHLIGIWS